MVSKMKRTDRRMLVVCVLLGLCLSFSRINVCAQEYVVTPMTEIYYVMYRVPFYTTPDLMTEQVGELVPQTAVEITGAIGNEWYQIRIDDEVYYETMSKAVNPYGDGLACERIIRVF